MTSKILQLLQNGHIMSPTALIQNYKKLKLTDKELIVLIYLLGNQEFDPEEISQDLNIKLPDTLKIIDSLTNKEILKISVKSGNCKDMLQKRTDRTRKSDDGNIAPEHWDFFSFWLSWQPGR